MKRIGFIGIGLAVIALVVVILLYNKSRMDARTKVDLFESLHVGVRPATKERISERLSLTGTITAWADVPLISETQGRVTHIFAGVGDSRSAGSIIAQVDDEVKQAQLAIAEVNFQRTQKDLERYTSLNEQNSASDWQKETVWQACKAAEAQLIMAKRQFNDTRIKMPINGIITSRMIDAGTMVQPGMVLANIVDISRLKVKINVPESDAFKLRVGDKTDVTTDIYPGVTFSGTISSISPKADEAHTYPVEITLANSREHPLRAGMFGRILFRSIEDKFVLAVPREALVGSLKSPAVYVVENGIARLRTIVAENESATLVPVLSGLQEGELVVVNGQHNLRDNVPVSITK